jgi:hypothetical protein
MRIRAQSGRGGGGVLEQLQADVVGERCCAAMPGPITTAARNTA